MGKRKQFDEIEVLDNIAEHFWKYGYSATKVDQLSEMTGLTKTSLYNAFGNKEALFVKAIGSYFEQGIHRRFKDMDTKKSLTENMERLFESFFDNDWSDKLPYGCLLTNSVLELAHSEPELFNEVTKRYDNLRSVMFEFFMTYFKSNRINTTMTPDELTNVFMTFLQGFSVQSRNGMDMVTLRCMAEGFISLLKVIEE